MKIAFQMEPLAEAKPEESNSLLMMREACRRGHEVYHYIPESLTMSTSGLYAPLARVEIVDAHLAAAAHHKGFDLAELDIILFRQDPPFDMAYVTNTYMLDFLHLRGVMVVNNPFWIRNAPDKLSIFDYKEHLPPTIITKDPDAIRDFFDIHEDIVIKPLYGFHGHGIVRTKNALQGLALARQSPEPLIFQPFLKEIAEGNKRIVFFDGDIVGALKSVPQDEKEFRIFRNSIDMAYELSAAERALCEKMGHSFRERGLLFVGIDLIGPYLTEVNIGSVGSLLRLNQVYGGAYEQKLFDVIEARYREFSN